MTSLFRPRPDVHGHRGCRGLFPENTLPAFLHALRLGVDVLEMDVVISQDGQVVVAHDPWLPAHLGYGPEGLPIDQRTERQQRLYALPYATIRQCALGVIPHPLFPSQQLVPTYRPLLREVLQASIAASQRLGRTPVRYSVEIKSTPTSDEVLHPEPEQFARLVLTELARAGVEAHTTLLSFDSRVLRAAHKQAPRQALCYLVEKSFIVPTLFSQLGFVPDVFGPAYQLLTPALLKQLRAHYPALQVVPWTVNDPADMAAMLAWQVEGITTDYPDRLLKLLSLQSL